MALQHRSILFFLLFSVMILSSATGSDEGGNLKEPLLEVPPKSGVAQYIWNNPFTSVAGPSSSPSNSTKSTPNVEGGTQSDGHTFVLEGETQSDSYTLVLEDEILEDQVPIPDELPQNVNVNDQSQDAQRETQIPEIQPVNDQSQDVQRETQISEIQPLNDQSQDAQRETQIPEIQPVNDQRRTQDAQTQVDYADFQTPETISRRCWLSNQIISCRGWLSNQCSILWNSLNGMPVQNFSILMGLGIGLHASIVSFFHAEGAIEKLISFFLSITLVFWLSAYFRDGAS